MENKHDVLEKLLEMCKYMEDEACQDAKVGQNTTLFYFIFSLQHQPCLHRRPHVSFMVSNCEPLLLLKKALVLWVITGGGVKTTPSPTWQVYLQGIWCDVNCWQTCPLAVASLLNQRFHVGCDGLINSTATEICIRLYLLSHKHNKRDIMILPKLCFTFSPCV